MSDTTSQHILVIGATGDIGRQLVALLHAAGEPVRAMCRKPGQIEEFRRDGVRAVHGDLGDPGSLRRAMVGCDRLLLLTVAAPTQEEHGRNAVDAAVAAGG